LKRGLYDNDGIGGNILKIRYLGKVREKGKRTFNIGKGKKNGKGQGVQEEHFN